MSESNSTQRGYAAIGQVCAQWSDLEWWCQRVAEVSAQFLATEFEEGDVGFVLTLALSHMDIRNKIAIAKVYVEQAKISRATRKRTLAVLNRIDNEHRPERNRYVHDEWIVGPHRAARTTLRPKIRQTQAWQDSRIIIETRMFSNEELEKFAEILSDEGTELMTLCNVIQAEYEALAPSLKSSQQERRAKAS